MSMYLLSHHRWRGTSLLLSTSIIGEYTSYTHKASQLSTRRIVKLMTCATVAAAGLIYYLSSLLAATRLFFTFFIFASSFLILLRPQR